MICRLVLRNDTADNWEQNNPILGKAEVGIVLDTFPCKCKVGDGVNSWNNLPLQSFSDKFNYKGLLFCGVCTPDTIFPEDLNPCFYYASTEGEYSNGLSLFSDESAFFLYQNNVWSKELIVQKIVDGSITEEKLSPGASNPIVIDYSSTIKLMDEDIYNKINASSHIPNVVIEYNGFHLLTRVLRYSTGNLSNLDFGSVDTVYIRLTFNEDEPLQYSCTVNVSADYYIPKTGGTFTGDLFILPPQDGSNPTTKTYVDELISSEDVKIKDIESKIPEQATFDNQLADKEFVNQSIAIHKYPVSDGYYYALMDSDKYPNSVKEGTSPKASIALGVKNIIGGNASCAAGYNNEVLGSYSSAFGSTIKVPGNYSFSTGKLNLINSEFSLVSGLGNKSEGDCSFATGVLDLAVGMGSVALGSNSSACGVSSVTLSGNWIGVIFISGEANATTFTFTVAEADAATFTYWLFEGNLGYTVLNKSQFFSIISVDYTNKTITLDTVLSAEAITDLKCYINATVAIGDYSCASRGIAKGNSSWTVNRGGVAIGNNSFVGGDSNIANNNCEVAFGEFNKSTTGTKSSLFTFGGGTSESDRKNLLELTSDGSLYLLGAGDYNGVNVDNAKSLQDVLSSLKEEVCLGDLGSIEEEYVTKELILSEEQETAFLDYKTSCYITLGDASFQRRIYLQPAIYSNNILVGRGTSYVAEFLALVVALYSSEQSKMLVTFTNVNAISESDINEICI